MKYPASQPVGSKILVLPDPKKEKTASGIIIPSSINSPLETGKVIAVSDKTTIVKAGDTVLYPPGAGVPHEYDGIKYLYLNGPTAKEAGDLVAIEL